MIGTQKGKFILRKHFIMQISVLHHYNGKFSKSLCHSLLPTSAHFHNGIPGVMTNIQIKFNLSPRAFISTAYHINNVLHVVFQLLRLFVSDLVDNVLYVPPRTESSVVKVRRPWRLSNWRSFVGPFAKRLVFKSIPHLVYQAKTNKF